MASIEFGDRRLVKIVGVDELGLPRDPALLDEKVVRRERIDRRTAVGGAVTAAEAARSAVPSRAAVPAQSVARAESANAADAGVGGRATTPAGAAAAISPSHSVGQVAARLTAASFFRWRQPEPGQTTGRQRHYPNDERCASDAYNHDFLHTPTRVCQLLDRSAPKSALLFY